MLSICSVAPAGSAGAVLARLREARAAAEAASRSQLFAVLEWAAMHSTDSIDDSATWWAAGVGDTGLPLAGAGAPMIAEFAVPELISALGMTPMSGRSYLAEAMEMRYRLPKLYARVAAGEVPVWRGRLVADATLALNEAAARFVDDQVAWCASSVSKTSLGRLVDQARATFDPALAQQVAEESWDKRGVRFDHQQVSFDGTVHLDADLDLADAHDLDVAITLRAEQLERLGSNDSCDGRRATALGELGRLQQALLFDGGEGVAETVVPVCPSRRVRRKIQLHLHLAASAITGADDRALACGRVESVGNRLVTADQVREWCRGADVTVVPVVDLNAHVRVEQWEVNERLRRHLALRDGTCVFPWCTRPARRLQPGLGDGHGTDCDHVQPWDEGGPTCSSNLAPLCRTHHRVKTHTAWRYRTLDPGVYEWVSPHGLRFLRDHLGTTDLDGPPNACTPTLRAGLPPDL